jgi:hypothetical protein
VPSLPQRSRQSLCNFASGTLRTTAFTASVVCVFEMRHLVIVLLLVCWCSLGAGQPSAKELPRAWQYVDVGGDNAPDGRYLHSSVMVCRHVRWIYYFTVLTSPM